MIQTTKYATVRDRKKPAFRYELLAWRTESCFDRLGHEPTRRARQVQGNREEEDRQGQERDPRRLHRPADRQPPAAADQVMEHRQAQASQGDPDPEDVAHQVGVEERSRATGARRPRRRPAPPRRRPAQPLDPVQAEPQLPIGHGGRGIDAHGWVLRPWSWPSAPSAGSFRRSSSGSSEDGACWLSWSTRMYAAIAQRSRGGSASRRNTWSRSLGSSRRRSGRSASGEAPRCNTAAAG